MTAFETIIKNLSRIAVECFHCHRKVDLMEATALELGEYVCDKCRPKWTCDIEECGAIEHSHSMYQQGRCSECSNDTHEYALVLLDELWKENERLRFECDQWRTICVREGVS
jgi:hypothetical protein